VVETAPLSRLGNGRARAVIPAALAFALVATCGAFGAAPSPRSFFGHEVGADRTVLDWDRVAAYFRALQDSSDRLLVQELGKSTEGRPFLAVIIAAPSTLARLDRYAWIQRKLADPRLMPEPEAERLIAEGKAVVMITCSIHSTEPASTGTAAEFAYRLATEDSPRVREILENTIILLVPSLNPDGLDLVTRWYRRTLGTAFEGTDPPELYQKYTGHDNNRDWYFFTQAETRLTVSRLHNVWHPQIVYDIHEQGPYAARMFVPPWMDPIDPHIDPIIVQECNAFGMGMAADLTGAGKTGVLVEALYDFWSPSRAYQAYHGGLRILSESASARLASPLTVRPDQIAASAPGYSPRRSSWNYLEPWTGGEWRLRDIIDYQLIAMESLVRQAAVGREGLLRNFYRIGLRALEPRSPAAFVIPERQRDPGAARTLLEKLAFGLVEVRRASEPAGSYVILTAQPYGAFARTLLEKQDYPDLSRRPYDVTAQTLPLLMGVEIHAVDSLPAVSSELVTTFRFESDGGPRASDTDSWLAASPHAFERRRIGIYKSFVPEPDEGWTRWLLEQFGFPYASLRNGDLTGADLRRRFDVLVFPDQAASTIADGYRVGSMPDEYTGGLGERGAAALKRFAEAGGTLVFFNRSARYATDALALPMRDVTAALSEREFDSPGSLLNADVDRASALAFGMPASIAIWSEASPTWEVPEGSPARVVVRYPQSKLLASGRLVGEKYLAGKAALLDVPLGSGRVILFGMRPQYRAQSYATFKLFFNALIDLRPGTPARP
jgi:Zinc carboxypeptidase